MSRLTHLNRSSECQSFAVFHSVTAAGQVTFSFCSLYIIEILLKIFDEYTMNCNSNAANIDAVKVTSKGH